MADIAQLPKPAPSRAVRALSFLHAITLQSLKSLPCDLSSRQLGILLTVYLDSTQHSVKSLAECMGVSKPAVCRALDILEQLKFVKRTRDKEDKRNVLIQRTVKGSVYLSELADIIVSVSKEAA